MDINYLISILIIIAFGLLGYTHYEHLSNEVMYVKSSYDNNEYLVRNLENKEDAANILAKLRFKLEKLCKIMKDKFKNDHSVIRMNERFNPDNITEAGKVFGKRTSINNALKGVSKTSCGFKWIYKK